MDLPFEIFLGLRYLRSKRKRSAISVLTWLSVIGVAIGVAALNTVLSVMNGFSDELKSKIIGQRPHITITGFQNHPVSTYDEITKTITGMQHVTAVGPYVEGQALARSRERSLGIMVWGIDPKHPQAMADLDKCLFEAKSIDLESPPDTGSGRKERIFLGYQLARRLDVNVGDDIILFLPVLRNTVMGVIPQSVKFQVVGLFQTGMFDYDNLYAYVSLPVGQKMYDLAGYATGVAVKVDNSDSTFGVEREIREKLHHEYFIQDWFQMNRGYFVAVQMEKIVMGIILSLIILVATFNIINPLTMMVVEKMKEIGILKAMGGSNSSVTSLFVFQGMFVAIGGTSIGLLVGYVLCQIISRIYIHIPGDVYILDRLPVKVEPYISYFITPSVSMILCFLAALYPARQAGKLEPVEAIRYE